LMLVLGSRLQQNEPAIAIRSARRQGSSPVDPPLHVWTQSIRRTTESSSPCSTAPRLGLHRLREHLKRRRRPPPVPPSPENSRRNPRPVRLSPPTSVHRRIQNL
jgi:hypothetical protein